MFNLLYVCKVCSHTVAPQKIDGRISPSPDFCTNCLRNSEVNRRITQKFEPGAIVKGFQLEIYDKLSGRWRVMCLFCKGRSSIARPNLYRQTSCGCMKVSPRFHLDKDAFQRHGVARIHCKRCEDFSVYDLTEVVGELKCKGCGL